MEWNGKWLPSYDDVNSEPKLAPVRGGEDSQDRDDWYRDPKANQTPGEDSEPLADEAQTVHVVAGVEVKTQEEHPEATGQQDDVCDGQADEVEHGDGLTQDWALLELIKIYLLYVTELIKRGTTYK